ncbi:hypothetical protein AJ79_04340 [Helicocarpus griseus UAMH5409]|uniref:Uncharacterized protein n=1 Tax=Helicocarpus griseus UAMH5409 TaxID=1447875 RepID=A0A2B7XUU5_9EURO|nr:hypothetical protein AJ79_04340 [Helicocarpus griseus UAMH5409]
MYYTEGLDSKYYEDNEEAEKQVKAFFNLKFRQPELHAVKQKVLELVSFEKEREELGINPRPNDDEELKRLQKLNAEWAKEDEERRAKDAEIEKSFVAPPGEDLNVQEASEAKVRVRWPLMTIGAAYLAYLVSRNWRR